MSKLNELKILIYEGFYFKALKNAKWLKHREKIELFNLLGKKIRENEVDPEIYFKVYELIEEELSFFKRAEQIRAFLWNINLYKKFPFSRFPITMEFFKSLLKKLGVFKYIFSENFCELELEVTFCDLEGFRVHHRRKSPKLHYNVDILNGEQGMILVYKSDYSIEVEDFADSVNCYVEEFVRVLLGKKSRDIEKGIRCVDRFFETFKEKELIAVEFY